VRVAGDDWAKVKMGEKTEFRASPHYVSQVWNVVCPTPVVGYTQKRVGGYDSTLLVLEATWQEPVGAISEESLAREGFPDMAHFRRYWMSRTKKRFAPLQMVHVFQVRPMREEDHVTMGLQLLHKLYREHL
jgi:hypothetical protein